VPCPFHVHRGHSDPVTTRFPEIMSAAPCAGKFATLPRSLHPCSTRPLLFPLLAAFQCGRAFRLLQLPASERLVLGLGLFSGKCLSSSCSFRSASSGLYRQTLNPPPAAATASAAFFPGPSILPRGRCALKKAAAWPFSAALRPVGCGRRLGGGFGRAVRKAAMNAASNTQHGDLP
jgi:hypothetical protein